MCSHKQVHALSQGGQLGNDLNTTGTNADCRHPFAGEVVFLIPAGGVNQLALEVLDALNVGPLPVVQDTTGIDEHIIVLCEDNAVAVLHGDLPLALSFVPDGGLDGVSELDVLFAVVLVCHVVHVLVDLLGGGVIVWP